MTQVNLVRQDLVEGANRIWHQGLTLSGLGPTRIKDSYYVIDTYEGYPQRFCIIDEMKHRIVFEVPVIRRIGATDLHDDLDKRSDDRRWWKGTVLARRREGG